MDAATFLRLVQAESGADENEGAISSQPADENVALANARASLGRRRLREKLFGDVRLVEGPAWEMLVDLYVSHLEQINLCIGSLCVTSGVPMTNAVRILAKLLEAHMVVRSPDLSDKRRCFIKLSDETLAKLDTYFSSS